MINQNWIFGQKARLDFSSGTPVPSTWAPNTINTFEGCAAISDANGNLLFYTDGMTVWDGTHTVQATGLLGNSSSTQSAIIVPNPGNSNQYYVFTADGTSGGNNHFNGVLIDVSTWGLPTPLSSLMTMPSTAGFSPTEKVAAIQHSNCKDFWVITVLQQAGTTAGNGLGTFRVFLVNSTGVQHIGDTPMNTNVHDLGYLKGSPDGKRVALANWQNRNVLVYPFNNSVGTFDIPNVINIPVPVEANNPNHPRVSYGIEFSPNNNFLYFSVIGATNTSAQARGYVYQLDLLLLNTVLVGQYNNAGGRYALGALQLGPDNLIYIAKDGENTLGVIPNPDTLNTNIINWNAVALASGSLCYMGLPNLIPNPCGCPCEGGCDGAVHEANQTLNDRADGKTFTVVANGQTLPGSCELAFGRTDFAPVFTLHWGDGISDQFESHDTEVIYFRVNNVFRNIVYRGVKIFNIRVNPNQTLPDGENTLQIIPAEIVCFEAVQPCSFVSRDFAFLIQNAVPQNYQISFDYCIEEIGIVADKEGRVAFDIPVVAS